jgi:hypothetical protein
MTPAVMTYMMTNKLAFSTNTEIKIWNLLRSRLSQAMVIKNTEQPKLPIWSADFGFFFLGELATERISILNLAMEGTFNYIREFALASPCTALAVRKVGESIDLIVIHGNNLVSYKLQPL